MAYPNAQDPRAIMLDQKARELHLRFNAPPAMRAPCAQTPD
jgi:hypothetical protein